MVVVVVMALDAVPENSKLEEDAGLPSARFSPCVFSAAAFSAVVVVVVIILGEPEYLCLAAIRLHCLPDTLRQGSPFEVRQELVKPLRVCSTLQGSVRSSRVEGEARLQACGFTNRLSYVTH